MNKKQLEQFLQEARSWTLEQYDLKGGNPETDGYYIQQQLARLTLLQHMEQTYIEKRENGKL